MKYKKLKKTKKNNDSIIPYILVFIGLPVIFYFVLFSLGGWIGVIIGVVITLFVLNKKWYS